MGLSQTNETLRLLQSSDWTEAQKALVASKAVHLPNLIDLLASGTPQVRTRAAIALRLIDDESAVSALVKAFADSDPAIRKEAVWALASLLRYKDFGYHGEPLDKVDRIKPLIDLGKSAVPHLVQLLDKSEEEVSDSVRFSISRTLGEIGDRGAVEGLLREIKRSSHWNLHVNMEAAAKFNDPRVIPAIIDKIDDDIESYGDTPGVWVLRELKDKAYPYLIQASRRHARDSVRGYCIHTLKHIGDQRAIPTILAATQDAGPFTRMMAFSALCELKTPDAAPAILRGLADEDKGVRAAATRAAAANQIQTSFEEILRMTKEDDIGIARAAVQALVQVDREKAKGHLLVLLLDERLCRYAIEGVKTLQMKEAEGVLISLLTSKERYVASDAATVLGLLKSTNAIPYLIEAINASTELLPSYASEALAQIGKPALSALLDEMRKAPHEKLAYYIRALRGTGDKAAVDAILPYLNDVKLDRSAIESLGELGDARAIKPLIEMLKSGRDTVRTASADALGKLKATEAVDILIEAMFDEKAMYVHTRAAAALGMIGDKRALEPLLKKAEKRFEGRWMVLEALGSFCDDRIVPLLIKDLEYEWPDSAAAARALGKIGDRRALPALYKAAASDLDRLANDAKKAIEEIEKRGEPTSTTSNSPQSA